MAARAAPRRDGVAERRRFSGAAARVVQRGALVVLIGACDRSAPAPTAPEATGTLTVDGAPAQLTGCRPGHAVHVFVDVDTTRGTLQFGDGALAWNGAELTCAKLDRSWGGGVRRDGSAYFRGTLAFRCGGLAGELSLDCGHITPEEAAELARNRAAARASTAPRSESSAPLPVPPENSTGSGRSQDNP